MSAIRALDADNKGYFDFRTFSQKMTPGIGERFASMDPTISESARENLHLPDLGPSKAHLATHIRKAGNIQQSVREVRQGFNPDYDTSKYKHTFYSLSYFLELVVSTRFGSKPPPPDTFANFQPAPTSAAHISEKARVTVPSGNRFLDTNVEFQREDRAKKLNLQQAKTEIKRANINALH
jgi:hypothetical protein